MLNKDEMTLICSQNDLEGATILKIAQQVGIDIRRSLQRWGGKLGNEPPENLHNLKKIVAIVELCDPPAEEKLRSDGHEVVIIDHHNYSGVMRFNSKSSLEQFCNLVGHPMTNKLWQIAANDSGFIPELFRLGMSYSDMEKVRIEERKILGTDKIFTEALDFTRNPENRKRFKDLDVLLVPFRFHDVMGEAAQWLDEDKYEEAKKENRLDLPNCLLIYQDETKQDNIVQIEFYGSQRYSDAFGDIVKDVGLNPFFEMWQGGSTSGCYWGAKPKGEITDEINKLIDRVLSFLLIQGRPLRYFSTTFLFPFSFTSEKLPEFAAIECSPDSYTTEEIIYFLPHIQKLFFSNGEKQNSRIKRWSLVLDEKSNYLDMFKTKEEKITLPIKEINLYQFFNGIHILEISVSKNTKDELWKNQPLWRLAFSSEILGMPSVDDILIFNNLARILYPSYSEQETEEKVPQSVIWHKPGNNKVIAFKPKFRKSITKEGSFSSVVKEMIAAFANTNSAEIDFGFVYDDRMFVHTCLAFAGDKPSNKIAEERYHALFTTATYVDQIKGEHESQNDYCYDESFVKKVIEPLTYSRWYGPYGNLYGFSRFSAVFLGFGKDFHGFVTKHISSMYLRQSIMALFYRSSLLYYNHLMVNIQYPLSHKNEEEVNKCLKIVRDIHWKLTLFSNTYWYKELTAQDQGIELFNLQTKAMDLNTEYDQVKQKIDRAYSILETNIQSTLDKISLWAGIIGLSFAIITILGTFAGLSLMMTDKASTFNHGLFITCAVLSTLGVLTAIIFLRKIVPKFIKLNRK